MKVSREIVIHDCQYYGNSSHYDYQCEQRQEETCVQAGGTESIILVSADSADSHIYKFQIFGDALMIGITVILLLR